MDNRTFRDAMGKFATGITIVSVQTEDEIKGMTVNAFMSVSLEPKLIAVSIDKNASLYETLQKEGKFGVSVLRVDQKDVSMIFAKQKPKDREIAFNLENGIPTVKDALVGLACHVSQTIKAGDHMIFIAEVKELNMTEGKPVLYYGGAYQELNSYE